MIAFPAEARCPSHPDRAAAATCSRCGLFVCEACLSSRDPALCSACQERRSAEASLLGLTAYSFAGALGAGFRLLISRLWFFAVVCALFSVPEAIMDATLEEAQVGFRTSYWASSLYGSTIGLIGVIACLATMAAGVQGRSLRLREALAEGLHAWGRVFVARLWAGIKISLWSLLLIVPGIVKWVQLSLVTPAAYLEPTADSHSRSEYLTDGVRWSLLGLLLLSTGMAIAASTIPSLLLGMAAELAPVLNLPGTCCSDWIVNVALLYPEAVALAAYYALRAQKDADQASVG
ncbi:MAG: hypothetical protein HY901_27255 [Deltaproteobacteria bacterium]|nr:hypothetical protein [Deltaproteobacteria bacterium]